MGFDDEFDEEFDEELDEDLDEDLEEELDEPSSKTPEEVVESKTPASRVITEGKKISVYFMSTIGPGEKKQKLNVNTGNNDYWLAWGHGGQQIAIIDKYNMVIVVTADPLIGQHGDKPWKYEKENLNLVADFINKLP